ncbi:ATP-binding protein [Methylocaldum sp.]|uniref:ATP-binding protein n=1 Tax=Methylocaldum sp. TaxID=1969727 RepID=UPI002D2A51A9|nr:ATP-binding protein [Methylocaldum sp.]HYE37963.1 ATP-binding protein [Methylocaldum sp.]
MTYSLQTRGLLVASVVLIAFLSATGLVLDKAFRDSAKTAMRDRLQGFIYTLLAGSELDARGVMKGPENLHEPRFNQTGSGLYADIRRGNRKPDWRSLSTAGIEIPSTPTPQTGTAKLSNAVLEDGTPVYVLSFSVLWEEERKKPVRCVFRVAETLDGFYAQVNQFRRSLWSWLGAAALVLLLVQGAILRWAFSPLRRVAADLSAIEAGHADKLIGHYPEELRGLTDNLNALLENAQSHLARYRDALGDLAHSLKTPLAVLRGAMERQNSDADAEIGAVAQEQIDRMTRIIEYQLKRAAASGRTHLTPPVSVAEKSRQVAAVLAKVYAEKQIDCRIMVDDDIVFHGDEGDLLEIIGNLLDNAFKWCRSRVELSARTVSEPLGTSPRLELRVDDDGPGIAADVAERVTRRGERTDSSVPGHGLGLAIVESIVRTYLGQLAIERSPLGGAAVMIRNVG